MEEKKGEEEVFIEDFGRKYKKEKFLIKISKENGLFSDQHITEVSGYR